MRLAGAEDVLEARVADGDGRLIGEESHELPLLARERSPLVEEDGEHAHDLVVRDEGNACEAAEARHAGQTPVPEMRRLRDVHDVFGPPRLHDPPRESL